MEKNLIIFNAQAGKSDNNEIAKKAKAVLERHGQTAVLKATDSESDAIHAAATATDQYDRLITIGGDGSINTACAGFLQAGKAIPLGIIPGGTVNNFARALKIPLNVDQAIDNLVSGMPKLVDLATVGDQPMVSSLTLGKLADISRDVKQSEKRQFGPIIYLFKGVKALFKDRSYKLRITANGKTRVLKAQILLITTTNSVGGNVAFNPDATYDDDLLHVFILKRFTLPKIITYGTFFLTGNLKRARGVIYLKCREIRIENLSTQKVETRIDGDPAMKLPITVKVKPNFLEIV